MLLVYGIYFPQEMATKTNISRPNDVKLFAAVFTNVLNKLNC